MDSPKNVKALELPTSISCNFHAARNECLDAFSVLETAAYRLAIRLKVDWGKGQLSQVIKKLKAAPAGPQLSKSNASDLKSICAEIASMLEERADIVHSTMTIASVNGNGVAFFRNAMAVSNRTTGARAYEICMLSGVADHAIRLAKKLDAIRVPAPAKSGKVTPASSPPPPLPGAAGAP